MSIRPGIRVAVNLAPFIGASSASKHTIACQTLEVRNDELLVRTEAPCRPVSLWVHRAWVERVIDEPHSAGPPLAGRHAARPTIASGV